MGTFTLFGGGPVVTVSSTSATRTTPSFHQSQGLSLIISDPLFYTNRSFSQRLTNQVERYSHEIRAVGGFWSSALTINDRQSHIEDWIQYGLGRHLELYNPALVVAWEGFVNKITATLGPFQYEIGPLLDIGNRVSVTYSTIDPSTSPPTMGVRETTSVEDNTDSQGRYGIVEKFYSLNGATSTEAEQIRDAYLNDPKYAYPFTSRQSSLGGGSGPSVAIECLGYWHWLRAFYPVLAGPGYVAANVKIQNVLGDNPNIGMFSSDTSMIAANATLVRAQETGERTAEDIIKGVVSMGDSSLNLYSAGFYAGRRFVYQPVNRAVEYQQRIASNRGLVNEVNREIKPWDAQAGKYILFPDFLVGRFPPTTSVTLGSDPRVGFVEVARFTAPWGLSLDGKKMSQLDQRLARKSMGSLG